MGLLMRNSFTTEAKLEKVKALLEELRELKIAECVDCHTDSWVVTATEDGTILCTCTKCEEGK